MTIGGFVFLAALAVMTALVPLAYAAERRRREELPDDQKELLEAARIEREKSRRAARDVFRGRWVYDRPSKRVIPPQAPPRG